MKHIKKRVAALLLTLAMVLSLAPMAFAADEFPDMPAEDDPSYAAVKSAIDNKIMTGENGELKLEGTILRSTVAKMVVTAFAAKGEADLSGYPDVDSEAWYAAWMAKANQMGIMTGTSGKMNPSNEVTLAEVAAMLCRALGLPTDEDAAIDGVAAWAAPYVKALIDAGYITAEDAAAAHEPMTRGNFAEVIYKVSGEGNYAKEENAEITEDVNGNIVITANGVSLKGITVKGDIIIADGVDAGSVVLDDVKVEGRIVVRGAGAELTNGTTASATVVAATTGETTVKADAGSDAGDIAVAGTNGMAADKVVLDMAEPKATVTAATELAVQNAEGGEITLQAPNASLSVESGTVANVTVADGASGVKVDVAEGATIDKVTTNTDLAITGEGTVSEKEGSGTVTDGSGNVVDGSDEPVDVPTVSEPAPADPNAPTNPVHTHQYTEVPEPFDATRHVYTCADKAASGTEGQEGYVPAFTGCGAVRYENHNFVEVTAEGDDQGKFKCTCGAYKPASTFGEPEPGAHACAEGTEHHWVKATGDGAYTAPGCETTGSQKWVCSNEVTYTGDDGEHTVQCTATKTETIPATGHNLVAFKSTAATCKDDGKTFFKCSNGCTEMDGSDWENENPIKTTVTTIPATGNHNWVLTGTTPATCAAEGHYTYKCTLCDTEDTSKTIAKNPNAHVWGTAAENDNGTHTYTCTVANCDTDPNTEGAQAATKTESHKLVKVTTGDEADLYKAPTCTVAGHEAAMKCSACDYKVAAAEIPATGHTPGTGYFASADGHATKCAKCGQATGTLAEHTWSKYTLDQDGKPTTTPAEGASCTVCGYKNGGGSQPAEHQHSKGSTIKYDNTQHWYICDGTETDCKDQKYDATNHNWGSNATSANGKCTGCDATHTCDTTGTDGACSKCGYKAPDQVDGG